MSRILVALVLLAGATVPGLAGVDESLLALAPAGSTFIAGIQMDQSRASSFGQFLLSQTDTFGARDPGFQKFVQQTGFDPRRDLQQVLFVGSPGRKPFEMTILARGNFDKARMEAAALANGGSVQKIAGLDVIVSGKGLHSPAVAFLGEGIVAVGTENALPQIVVGGGTPKIDSALLSQIESLSAANNAWFVTIVPANMADAFPSGPGGGSQAQRAQVFRSVLQASGGIQLADRVKVSMDAIARSPQDAVSLTDVVRMLASMAQTQRQNGDPKAAILAAAIDQMSLSANGSAMHLSLSFAEKDFEQLAALQPGPAVRRRNSNQTTK